MSNEICESIWNETPLRVGCNAECGACCIRTVGEIYYMWYTVRYHMWHMVLDTTAMNMSMCAPAQLHIRMHSTCDVGHGSVQMHVMYMHAILV